MNKLRKIFTASVMVTTLAVMLGFGSFAYAATPQAGDLIKMDGLSTVYFLGKDSKRYVFPHESVFFSWHRDFSGVVTVSASELQSYPLGANITMRPGTKLVKITTDPSVYAVEPNGVLRKIQSESDAIAIYGTNWAKRVVDVADSFFTNYTIGKPLASGEIAAGSLVKKSDDATVYYFDGTNYRAVASESAFYANRLSFNDMIVVTKEISPKANAISNNEFAYDPQNATGPVVTGSGVTVSLSATTPAANDLPVGTANTMLKFNITAANDGSAVISGVKLSAIGLGTSQNIKQISVYKDNVKLNNTARDIDSNREAQINFTNAVTISAGTTATFEVKAMIDGEATGKYGLSIAKATDVMAGNTVSGSFPINGNIFTAASVAVGKLTFTDDSALSEVKLGDKGATIAKVKLANDSVENITVKAVTFKKDTNSSASDGAVENLKLNFDGQEVASAPSISNRYVTFTLNNPITINKSISNKRLTVTADVVDGAGKTIGLAIESASDVVATGDYYGYQSKIDTTALTSRLVTIKAGTVSIEKVNATSDKLRVDVDNQEVGTFKITANSGKNAELSTLKLTITSSNDNNTATTSFAKIENVEVYNKTNNTVYDLAHVATTTASGVKVYANTSMGLMLTSGVTNELVVRFDTLPTATNEDYTVKIANALTDLIIKETGNDTAITDITPNTVELKKVTVETAGANFSLNALSTDYTAVIGTPDVEVLNFNIKAAQNSDAYLRDLTIKKNSGSLNFTTQTVSAIKLWNGTTLVKTMSSSQIGGGTDLTFTDLNEKIAANNTINYKVTVSFVKNTDSSGEDIKFALKDASVEATDGKTITTTPIDLATLISARTVAMVGTGSLYVAMDNGDASTNRDSYQLAGTQTGAIAALKLKAENESVKVTKLILEANQNLNGIVSELGLYDGSNLIGSTNVIATDNTIEISGDKLVVPTNSKNYYVKATLSSIGKNQTGTSTSDITFSVKGIEATGYDSSESLTNNDTDALLESGEIGYDAANDGAIDASATETGVSKKMAVVASRISAVGLVSSASNVSLATSLTDGQAANAAIISVTAPASSNTEQNGDSIKTRISQIVVSVATSSKITAYTTTIERVNGTATAVTGTPGTASATFTGLSGADYEVMPGETAYFLVKVVPVFTAAIAGDSSINVGLNDLSSNFTWKDASSAADKTDLRLSITKVDGTTIKN